MILTSKFVWQRSIEDEFDVETTAQSRVDRSTGSTGVGLAGSGDVERTFDAETVALSIAAGDGRNQEPVPAMATGVRPARSSWEKRQLPAMQKAR